MATDFGVIKLMEEAKKRQDALYSSDYGMAGIQAMLMQMQNNMSMMVQQMMAQQAVPEYVPPPHTKPRKPFDPEAERAKIRARLEADREKNARDKRALSTTLRTNVSLLSTKPQVISGESLLEPEED